MLLLSVKRQKKRQAPPSFSMRILLLYHPFPQLGQLPLVAPKTGFSTPTDHPWKPITLASIATVSKEKWFAQLNHAWVKWTVNRTIAIHSRQLLVNVVQLNTNVVSRNNMHCVCVKLAFNKIDYRKCFICLLI